MHYLFELLVGGGVDELPVAARIVVVVLVIILIGLLLGLIVISFVVLDSFRYANMLLVFDLDNRCGCGKLMPMCRGFNDVLHFHMNRRSRSIDLQGQRFDRFVIDALVQLLWLAR